MRRAVVATAVVLLAGCGTKPQLLRHYAQVEGATAAPTLELSVFMANPKAGDSKAPILGLHERAQAELVKALAERAGPGASAKQLVAAVMESPDEQQRPCAWADKTVLNKRVVFTLLGDLTRPADRVDKLEVSLKLADVAKGKFTSWDRSDSVYASIDIGSAKFTQTDKLTLDRTKTATAGGIVRVLDFGAESTDVLEETAKYALRRLSLGGALTPEQATLILEGGPNLNLFGTATATISLKLTAIDDNLPVYRLNLKKDGQTAAPTDVTIERCQAKVAKSSSAGLAVSSSGKAWIREALSGDSTVSEGDDLARIRSVSLNGPQLELSTADELLAETYGLVLCPRGAGIDRCGRVRIEVAEIGPGASDVVKPSVDDGRRVGLADKDDGAAALSGVTKEVAEQLRVARLWHNR